jgi:hypothetical protein
MISLCLGRPGRCRQIGKRTFANKDRGVSGLTYFDIVKITPGACLHQLVPCGELAAGLRVIIPYFGDLFPRGRRTLNRVFSGTGRGEHRRHIIMMSSPP